MDGSAEGWMNYFPVILQKDKNGVWGLNTSRGKCRSCSNQTKDLPKKISFYLCIYFLFLIQQTTYGTRNKCNSNF